MKIRVDNGKYTFQTASNGYGIDVLRCDEGWASDLPCPKAIHSMMYELDAARVVLAAVRELADSAVGIRPCCAPLLDALDKHDRLVGDREPPSEWAK